MDEKQQQHHQQQHTLLINCETILRRKRSSAEERVAALTVANRVVVRTLSSLSDSNNAQFQFQFQLSLVLATLFETVFGRNAVFVRRMLQTDGLVGLALSLARCCVGWLAALDAEQQQADNVWAALCIHTQSMARILNESSDPEVCFQIMDIFTQLLSNERGVVSLIENQVLASIVASITKAETCQKRRKPDDPAIPFTPDEPITLINHLISSIDVILNSSTIPSTKIEESLTHLLTNLVSLFETIEMPLKAEIPPLIIPLLHMIPSPPPLPHLLQTICHLLQNKLPQTTQTSLLMLASTAFHVLGPSFLFQLSPTPEAYKHSTLLIHLTCTDLRVLLDMNNPSTSVTVSHITFITDALTAIVQTESLDFPSDLLISVHHALAETFVAVLAHLVDLYEGWREAGSSGVFGDDKEGGGGVVKAVVEGLGVWLAEDTEASSIAEVKAGLGVLVHCAKRGNGCEDLGGVFMNVTGAGDECVERFLECGGGDLVAGWVLYGSGEERRVGVCCVLNLVVSGVGVGRLVEGGNVRDVSTRLLECLVKEGGDLRVKVTEDVVVHVMNACCLALFVVRDCIDLSEGLRNEVVACSVQALYHTRSLTSSWEDVKELWFLSVNALSEIVARGEDIRALLGRIDEFIGLVKACGEIAEQAGDGDEAQFDRESVLGFLKAFTSQ